MRSHPTSTASVRSRVGQVGVDQRHPGQVHLSEPGTAHRHAPPQPALHGQRPERAVDEDRAGELAAAQGRAEERRATDVAADERGGVEIRDVELAVLERARLEHHSAAVRLGQVDIAEDAVGVAATGQVLGVPVLVAEGGAARRRLGHRASLTRGPPRLGGTHEHRPPPAADPPAEPGREHLRRRPAAPGDGRRGRGAGRRRWPRSSGRTRRSATPTTPSSTSQVGPLDLEHWAADGALSLFFFLAGARAQARAARRVAAPTGRRGRPDRGRPGRGRDTRVDLRRRSTSWATGTPTAGRSRPRRTSRSRSRCCRWSARRCRRRCGRSC